MHNTCGAAPAGRAGAQQRQRGVRAADCLLSRTGERAGIQLGGGKGGQLGHCHRGGRILRSGRARRAAALGHALLLCRVERSAEVLLLHHHPCQLKLGEMALQYQDPPDRRPTINGLLQQETSIKIFLGDEASGHTLCAEEWDIREGGLAHWVSSFKPRCGGCRTGPSYYSTSTRAPDDYHGGRNTQRSSRSCAQLPLGQRELHIDPNGAIFPVEPNAPLL
jgi:hypothetical protein